MAGKPRCYLDTSPIPRMHLHWWCQCNCRLSQLLFAAAMEDRAAGGEARLPSLVVCPSTLVLHWAHEVHKFAGAAIRTIAYHGNPGVSPASF